MASLAATNWPQPAILVPCLSWSTASGVFTKVGLKFINFVLNLITSLFLFSSLFTPLCFMVLSSFLFTNSFTSINLHDGVPLPQINTYLGGEDKFH